MVKYSFLEFIANKIVVTKFKAKALFGPYPGNVREQIYDITSCYSLNAGKKKLLIETSSQHSSIHSFVFICFLCFCALNRCKGPSSQLRFALLSHERNIWLISCLICDCIYKLGSDLLNVKCNEGLRFVYC